MTPKEKAKELVEKYRKYVDDGRHNGFYSGEITFNNQKQCALITVDELLNNFLSNTTTKYGKERYHFWQEVKQEILKL
jgi:hypothetical protein